MSNLIEQIMAFCERTDMPHSSFGFYAVGDGKFVARIKRGGRCWPETEQKVRDYIAKNSPTEADTDAA